MISERVPEHVRRRQDAVPVIYVNGSHYEVGYMIVSANRSVIFASSYTRNQTILRQIAFRQMTLYNSVINGPI